MRSMLKIWRKKSLLIKLKNWHLKLKLHATQARYVLKIVAYPSCFPKEVNTIWCLICFISIPLTQLAKWHCSYIETCAVKGQSRQILGKISISSNHHSLNFYGQASITSASAHTKNEWRYIHVRWGLAVTVPLQYMFLNSAKRSISLDEMLPNNSMLHLNFFYLNKIWRECWKELKHRLKPTLNQFLCFIGRTWSLVEKDFYLPINRNNKNE